MCWMVRLKAGITHWQCLWVRCSLRWWLCCWHCFADLQHGGAELSIDFAPSARRSKSQILEPSAAVFAHDLLSRGPFAAHEEYRSTPCVSCLRASVLRRALTKLRTSAGTRPALFSWPTRCDPAEIGGRDVRDRVVVLPPVERVERLRTHLELRAAAQGERLRNRQVHATAAWRFQLRRVLCARPHCCSGARVCRHQRVRAAVEVLQRIAPVIEYLVPAVVIGPAVADAGRPARSAAARPIGY